MVLRKMNQSNQHYYLAMSLGEEKWLDDLLGIKVNHHNFRRNVISNMPQLRVSAEYEGPGVLQWGISVVSGREVSQITSRGGIGDKLPNRS
jgi:hypothetical protein